jgi:large subunit ribosomal protein L17
LADTEAPARATLVAQPTAAPVQPAAVDDLELIEGIGPKIAGVLRDAGVVTFAQLAAMTSEQIEAVVRDGGVRLFDATSWPEQAALAAAGKLDELNALQETLNAGRRE